MIGLGLMDLYYINHINGIFFSLSSKSGKNTVYEKEVF